MRKYIEAVDKKNEIRLLFNHPSYRGKIMIVVEGQSDVRLFRSLIENEAIKLESIDGKKDLVTLVSELNSELPGRVIGICDADHDHLTAKAIERESYSVYVTDVHDAEMLMLISPAIHSFLNEYSAIENIGRIKVSLLDNALVTAMPIGLLRWINAQLKANLNFKGLNYSQFIDVDKDTATLNLDSLVDILLVRSKNSTIDKQTLMAKLAEYQNVSACRYQVCSGHDVTNIISMIYRQKWASLDANMDIRKVESSLRLGYQWHFFSSTELCRKLTARLQELGVALNPPSEYLVH